VTGGFPSIPLLLWIGRLGAAAKDEVRECRYWIEKKAMVNQHREVPYRLIYCDKDKSIGDPDAADAARAMNFSMAIGGKLCSVVDRHAVWRPMRGEEHYGRPLLRADADILAAIAAMGRARASAGHCRNNTPAIQNRRPLPAASVPRREGCGPARVYEAAASSPKAGRGRAASKLNVSKRNAPPHRPRVNPSRPLKNGCLGYWPPYPTQYSEGAAAAGEATVTPGNGAMVRR
jgi:hypothetical protein